MMAKLRATRISERIMTTEYILTWLSMCATELSKRFSNRVSNWLSGFMMAFF